MKQVIKEFSLEQEKTMIELQRLALVSKAVNSLIDAYLEFDFSIEELGEIVTTMAKRKIDK